MRFFVPILLLIPALASAAPPKGFDARVQAVLQQQGVPGATVAIVEDGKVTLARGYGVRGLEHPEPVGADTLFQIGSTTKAFDHGRARHPRRRGQDRLGRPGHRSPARISACTTPGSRAKSRCATCSCIAAASAAARATCCSCPTTNFSRADTVRRLRFLKPATSFRSGFAYDNVLYIGRGPGDRGGQRADLGGVRQRTHARSRRHDRRPSPATPSALSVADRAYPHGRVGELRGIGTQEALRREGGRARRQRRPGRRDRRGRQRPRALARGSARGRAGSGLGEAPVLRRARPGDVAAGRADSGHATPRCACGR